MSESVHPVDLHVGERIRTRRKLMEMSQSALAEALDLSFQQIQKYERGANRVSASMLWEIGQVLGVPTSYFYDGYDVAALKELPEEARSAVRWLRSEGALPLAHNMARLDGPMQAIVADPGCEAGAGGGVMTTTDTLRARLEDKPGVLGATITLCGGGYFDFIEPERSDIRIGDIARGLSTTTRFGGQASFGDGFYSVAQHCVLVSRLVEPEHAFAGLMHDAAEAYVGDMVGPLKQLCPDFKAIEKRVETAIFARFGIGLPLHPSIKIADLRALRTEQRDLTSGAGDNWNGLDGYPAAETPITPLPPAMACELFLTRAGELRPDLVLA